MQRKFRVSDDIWDDFCASLPDGVTPSDKLREMVQHGPLGQIMGVEEAAEIWSKAPGYIKNMCSRGELKCKKIGKTWILDKNQPYPKQERPSE